MNTKNFFAHEMSEWAFIRGISTIRELQHLTLDPITFRIPYLKTGGTNLSDITFVEIDDGKIVKPYLIVKRSGKSIQLSFAGTAKYNLRFKPTG